MIVPRAMKISFVAAALCGGCHCGAPATDAGDAAARTDSGTRTDSGELPDAGDAGVAVDSGPPPPMDGGTTPGFDPGAADVNGDGFADVVVGAPGNGAAGSSAGRAYVLLGGPVGALDVVPDGTLTGEMALDVFGISPTVAGDVNGDGFADVLVGATQGDGGALPPGRALVFFGSAGGTFDATPDLVLIGEAASDIFGSATAAAGDVDGDSVADLLVGAAGHDGLAGTDAGRAYVYLGGPSLDAAPDWVLDGAATDDRFGYAAAGAGDLDGDGFDDVVVDAHGSDLGGPQSGAAYVFFGGPAATRDAVPDGVLVGAPSDYLGLAVAGAGDVDADGYADVLVGAPSTDLASGRALLFRGGPGATFDATPDVVFTGLQQSEKFGAAVASAGDLDGDGYADVAIGAPYSAVGGLSGLGTGRVYVFFGGPGGPDADADLVLVGEAFDDRFGTSVAAGRDMDGDGLADLWVGAPYNGDSAGAAYLFLGSAAPSSAPALVLFGEAGDALGSFAPN